MMLKSGYAPARRSFLPTHPMKRSLAIWPPSNRARNKLELSRSFRSYELQQKLGSHKIGFAAKAAEVLPVRHWRVLRSSLDTSLTHQPGMYRQPFVLLPPCLKVQERRFRVFKLNEEPERIDTRLSHGALVSTLTHSVCGTVRDPFMALLGHAQ
jgi:hypothetical protein